MAEQPFRPEDGGEFRPNAFEVEQHFACQRRRVCPKLSKKRVALGFDRFDLVEQQFEPVEFACDRGLEIVRQRAPVAGRQFVEPLAAVAPDGLVAGDPLREQQTFDAVYMLDALCDVSGAATAHGACSGYRRNWQRFESVVRSR